jgi:hypothetical protein
MKKKTNVLKTECLKLFWAFMAVLLCTAPCVWADEVKVGETLNLNSAIMGDYLDVYGTLNMYPGAYVDEGIYAYSGCKVNIYAGDIGSGWWILVSDGAAVTVYGKAFALNDTPLDPIPDQLMFTGGSGTLTVTYDDDSTADLLFYSDIPINLVDTAVSDPVEKIQDLINLVASFNLQQGIDNSLDAKLDAALGALDDVNQNNDAAAINTLQAFINAVEAQRDNKITSEQADELITAAQAIIDLLST